MKLANPASWITEQYLRRQAENPELTDAQVLQLHGCVWAASSSDLDRPGGVGTRAPSPATRLAEGRRSCSASTAPTAATRPRSSPAHSTAFVCRIVGLWERPDGRRPTGRCRRGGRRDRHEAMERFDVLELACDPSGWHCRDRALARAYGDAVVEFPTNQRRRMAAAVSGYRGGADRRPRARRRPCLPATSATWSPGRRRRDVLGRIRRRRPGGSTPRSPAWSPMSVRAGMRENPAPWSSSRWSPGTDEASPLASSGEP